MKSELIETFNWTKERWIIAVELLKLNIKKPINLSELSRFARYSRTDPTFIKVISHFIDMFAIREVGKNGISTMVIVDKKKILEVMMESDLWESFITTVKIKNDFWNIYKI